MDETKFLGTILIQGPKLFPILEGIKEKYNIPDIDPTKDGIRERLIAEAESDDDIDWDAVKSDLESEIRNIPDLLPPELNSANNLLAVNDNLLNNKPTFTEPVTEKLKADILNLYDAYVNLHNQFTNITAAVYKEAIDSYFSGLVEIAYEYLYTGKVREIPFEWISVVKTSKIFDEEVVIAIATRAVDPDEITQAFRQKLTDTFKDRKPKLTKDNLPFTEYLAMKLREIPLKDIADEYILRHPREFPKDPTSQDYLRKKRELKSRLKMKIRRLNIKLENMIGNTK